MSGILASYEYLDATLEAIGNLRDQGYTDITVYSPLPEHNIEHALGYDQSPVRVFTLVGGLTGAATGLAFTTWTSLDWPLVTGGKPIVSIPAYIVLVFEMMVLFGALATVIGLFINARIPNTQPLVIYDPGFSSGRFGVWVPASGDKLAQARKILQDAGPVETREDREGARNG